MTGGRTIHPSSIPPTTYSIETMPGHRHGRARSCKPGHGTHTMQGLARRMQPQHTQDRRPSARHGSVRARVGVSDVSKHRRGRHPKQKPGRNLGGACCPDATTRSHTHTFPIPHVGPLRKSKVTLHLAPRRAADIDVCASLPRVSLPPASSSGSGLFTSLTSLGSTAPGRRPCESPRPPPQRRSIGRGRT